MTQLKPESIDPANPCTRGAAGRDSNVTSLSVKLASTCDVAHDVLMGSPSYVLGLTQKHSMDVTILGNICQGGLNCDSKLAIWLFIFLMTVCLVLKLLKVI
jgi:hypothetical protein